MNDIQQRWEHLRTRLDSAASGAKESQEVVLELSRRYSDLSAVERDAVDSLLADWVISDDENLRFDALALIDDHMIRSAVPSLRELASRLATTDGPSAFFEKAKVERLLTRLAEA